MKMLGVPPAATAVASAPAAPAPAADEPDEAEGPPPVEETSHQAPPGSVAVPSLAGLPLRAAVRALESLDLAADLQGSGRVVRQSPPAGRVVARGSRVRMTLQPAG